MGDIDEGDAQLLLQALELNLHLAPELEIQCTKRLIQQKDLRLVHKGTGNSHTLPLSAGQLCWLAGLIARKLHQSKRIRNGFFTLKSRHVLQLQRIADVLPHIHMGEKSIILEDHVHIPFFRREIGHILPVEEDGTAVTAVQPCNDAKQGCLSAAGRGQNGDKLPRHNTEINPAEDFNPVKAFSDLIQFQHSIAQNVSLP